MLDDQARGGPVAVAAGAPTQLQRTTTLVFDGFNADDALLIEEYLVAFTGYVDHRPIYCAPRHCEYSYKHTVDDASLTRKLNLMLERMGVSGFVTTAGAEIKVSALRTGERRRAIIDGL